MSLSACPEPLIVEALSVFISVTVSWPGEVEKTALADNGPSPPVPLEVNVIDVACAAGTPEKARAAKATQTELKILFNTGDPLNSTRPEMRSLHLLFPVDWRRDLAFFHIRRRVFARSFLAAMHNREANCRG